MLIVISQTFFVAMLKGQCTFTTTAPYTEDFSTLAGNNQMPNCSWSASNLGATCLTYTANGSFNRIGRNDTRFASFYYQPGGDNYFFTNGVLLNPGVTYEAKVWYTTEVNGFTNWTNLAILMSPSQSTIAMQPIASISGTVFSPVYTDLAGTFTVATTGLYYFAIKATSSGSCCANYLSIDDFAITIPCVSLVSTPSTVCFGQSATITALQANTFTWSTGANTPSIVVTPTAPTNYWVVAGNTLAPCVVTKTIFVPVVPNPTITVFVPANPQCEGKPFNLNAFGASTYTWSSGAIGSSVVITPTASSMYSVNATDANGCEATAAIQLTVLPNPTITVVASSSVVCEGQVVSYTASGASTYSWSAPDLTQVGPVLTVTQTASGTTYIITATGSNGCVAFESITQNVSDCTGISEVEQTNLQLFYDAFTESLLIKSQRRLVAVSLSNTSGFRREFPVSGQLDHRIGLQDLASGLYFLYVENGAEAVVKKFIKY